MNSFQDRKKFLQFFLAACRAAHNSFTKCILGCQIPEIGAIDQQIESKNSDWGPFFTSSPTSCYASLSCLTGDCDVVLFLHGSDQSENAGPASFFNHYSVFQEAQHPRVLIFANGIYADPGAPIPRPVWKTRTYNGAEMNHPRMLQKLVGGIAEGSIRVSGPTMRITTQLIDVADDVHFWSETYDRNIDDVFAAQDEISTCTMLWRNGHPMKFTSAWQIPLPLRGN